MYLKQLKLKNFQKHSDLTLDFCKSVNVIVGDTGTGKSCIIRALRWILFNEISGDDVRKEGTKKTEVEVIFDNDISVKRIKSKTVNAYVLKVKEEEKRFDSVGREIPEEIKNIIKMDLFEVDGDKINLNISNQIGLPFLLDKTGSFRNKLFNKLTGADKIDKAMQSLNKDILDLNRQEKSNKEFIENNEDKLDNYKKDIKIKKEAVDKTTNAISELEEKYNKLETLKDKSKDLKNTEIEIEMLKERNKPIKVTEEETKELSRKIEKLTQLNNYYMKLKEIKKNLNDLKDTNIPKYKKEIIENTIEKINFYKLKLKNLKEIDELEKKYNIEISELELIIEGSNNKYKELLKESGTCPVCKQKIKE